MASTSLSSSICEDEQNLNDWLLARRGIQLLINNKNAEAEELFLKYTDNLSVYSGYSFATFMDALMTLEEEKINLALNILGEVERRCNQETYGWFKSVKAKVFGNSPTTTFETLAKSLEDQIILADSQVCQSILIILNADLSGYLKCGWVLRKSWKIYQSVYREVMQLHKTLLESPLKKADYDESFMAEFPSPTNSEELQSTWDELNEPYLASASANGYKSKLPTSKSAILSTTKYVTPPPSSSGESSPNSMENNCANSTRSSISSIRLLKKSISINSALTSKQKQSWTQKLSPLTNSLSLTYFTSPSHFSSIEKMKNIDPKTVKRLMAAVSFGYGLFQLGVSLLPPSLLKVSSFLGFGGNRNLGIDCLMFSRTGVDMRAPLATLSLLWYHTIVRPFYALDGSNVQAGVDAAKLLLEEMENEYQESSLYLFFKGRVERLNSNIPEAIQSFQASVENATQREIKILSLHDVGWCHLIQMDFKSGESIFLYLKSKSRWSRGFYSYISAICTGANNNFNDFDEIRHNIETERRGNQLDEFLLKRSKLFPKNNTDLTQINANYFKLLIYEMLYLWNTLPSCSPDSINKIITDCKNSIGGTEPMLGLSYLIIGYCNAIQKMADEAIFMYRECLKCRKSLPFTDEYGHISAFAQFELAMLLLRNQEDKTEAKTLLQQIGNYKNFDFEQRLHIRVHSILKSL